MNKDKKENRINSLALTFLERQQIRPNIFADQIIRGYKEGYHQAEKDNELTWEDIHKIFQISEELKISWWFRDDEQTKLIGTQVFWEEVLKRFKDYRERKRHE